MTKNDVNRMFTEKVTELIAEGYQINTGTMCGTEGEIAHIDLRKGSEILRVLLMRECNFHSTFTDIFCIKVGRSTDRIRDDWQDLIWNSRLEILSEIKLAKISDTYFTAPEDAEAMSRKRIARWKARGEARREYGDAYKSVALRWLRRQPRMGRCKLEDVESLTKYKDGGRASYQIKAKGKTYTLAAREA